MFLLSLCASSNLKAVTVTAHVGYSPRVQHGNKVTEGSEIVVWLTPLSNELEAQAESGLGKLPHRFQLVQAHKHFDPHLLIVPVGSLVEFPNRDPFFHNVFSLFDGKRFDLGLYEAGSTRSIRFDRPGVSFIFCNIHPQMSAVIIAMKTPYFGVADTSGQVMIHGVPPGRYRMEIWSERALPETLKNLQRDVVVDQEPTSLGTIQVKTSGDILAGHKNKYGTDYDTNGGSYPSYKQPQ